MSGIIDWITWNGTKQYGPWWNSDEFSGLCIQVGYLNGSVSTFWIPREEYGGRTCRFAEPQVTWKCHGWYNAGVEEPRLPKTCRDYTDQPNPVCPLLYPCVL